MAAEADDIEGLVKASASGNKDSYKALYEHLVSRIYAYVKYRVKNADTATDVTQDIFIDLWNALPKMEYRGAEAFYGFVFMITKRKIMGVYAKNRGETVEFDEATMSNVSAPGTLEDAVTRALDRLDERDREIMVLKHWSRYTFGEIAALIGMEESAVRVRHHRAGKMLREVLGEFNT